MAGVFFQTYLMGAIGIIQLPDFQRCFPELLPENGTVTEAPI